MAAVNFFLGCVGTVQVSRILLYRRSVGASDVTHEVKAATEGLVEEAREVAHEANVAVKEVAHEAKVAAKKLI